MSDINVVFTLNSTQANFTIDDQIDATFAIQDQITANFAIEGVYVANGYNNQAIGPNGAVQYANGNALAGDANLVFDAANTTLITPIANIALINAGNVAANNISIAGNVNANVITANSTTTTNLTVPGNTTLVDTTTTTLVVSDTTTLQGNLSATNIAANGNLNVSGNTTLANLNLVSNANIHIDGGAPNQVLRTDGNGNLSWANAALVGGVDTQIQYNRAGNLAGSANLTFDDTTNTFTTYSIVASNLIVQTNTQLRGNLTSNANITYTGANANLGDVANIHILGGSNTQVLSTDGFGSLSWRTINTDRISNGNTNVVAQSDRVLISVNGQPNTVVLGSNGSHATALFQQDLTVTGNLTVQGNAIYANTETLIVEDPIIEEGGGPNGAPLTFNDGKDRGLLQHYYVTGTGPVDAFIGWNTANSEFAFGSNVLDSNSVITFYEFGNVRGNWWLGNTSGMLSNVGTLTATNANINNVVANTVSANFVSTANASVMDTLNVGNTITAVDVFTSNIQAGSANIYELVASYANVANLNSNGNVSFTGVNVSLGANTNLHITGGNSGQTLITDGAGNLRWGNAGGTPGGVNTAIQFNSNGVFGGSANLTFVDDGSGGTITAVNVDATTADISNTLNVGGIVNLFSNLNFTGMVANLGTNANVVIGGGSNNQVLQTDGAGNLRWSNVSTTSIGDNLTNVNTSNSIVTIAANGLPNVFVISSNGTAANTSIRNDVTIGGNLTVGGTLTYVGVQNLSVEDPLLDVGGGPNGTPLVTPDLFDRGLVLHTYGNGVRITTLGQANVGNVEIAVVSVGNVDVGQPVFGLFSNGGQVFPSGTTVTAVDVGNTTITVSQGPTANIPSATGLFQGQDFLSFIGYDQANAEFSLAANAGVINNIIQYNQLGNMRGSYWLGNLLGATVTTTGNITTGATLVGNGLVVNNATVVNTVSAGNVIGGNISATGNLSGSYLNVGGITATGNVQLIGANTNLGNIANLHIYGGNGGQVLTTDGFGGLSWADGGAGGGGNAVPYIHWDVVATANNQSFTNGNLTYYASPNALALFRNGVYVEPTDYTVVGTIITINVKLWDGDYLDIIPGGGGGAGGGTSDYGNANVALYLQSYNGNIAGNVISPQTVNVANTLNVAGNTQLSNLVVTGQLGLTNLNLAGSLAVAGNTDLGSNLQVRIAGGNSGQFLRTDGNGVLSWANAVTSAPSSIANGTSSVSIPTANGNVLISANGQANIISVYSNGTRASTTIQDDATITGNLTVQGNTNYINVNSLVVTDPIIQLGSGANGTVPPENANDLGLLLRGNTAAEGGVDRFMGWDTSNSEFVVANSAVDNNNIITVNSLGNIRANTYIANGAFIVGNSTIANSITLRSGNGVVTSNLTMSNVSGNFLLTLANSAASGYFALTAPTTGGSGILANLVSANGAIFTVYNTAASVGVNYGARGVESIGTNQNILITPNGTGQVAITSNISNANITTLIGNGNVVTYQLTPERTTLKQYTERTVAGGTVSGVITPDAANGTIYTYTLDGNITLNTIANAVAGTSMTIILTQDAVGNRTLTSSWRYQSGRKTLSTAADTTDIVYVFYDGTNYWASLTQGYV